MVHTNLHHMVGAALLAAIMAILSQVAFPVGPVPITLQTFVCALAGGVLGWRWGTIAIAVWLFLGAIGIPILTAGKAGFGIFMSPVGGYYLGFLVMAAFCGICVAEKGKYVRQISLSIAGLIACYVLGTLWFMAYFYFGLHKDMPLWQALTLTVFPFVVFDIIKIVLGVLCGTQIRHALQNAGYFDTKEK